MSATTGGWCSSWMACCLMSATADGCAFTLMCSFWTCMTPFFDVRLLLCRHGVVMMLDWVWLAKLFNLRLIMCLLLKSQDQKVLLAYWFTNGFKWCFSVNDQVICALNQQPDCTSQRFVCNQFLSGLYHCFSSNFCVIVLTVEQFGQLYRSTCYMLQCVSFIPSEKCDLWTVLVICHVGWVIVSELAYFLWNNKIIGLKVEKP